MISLVVVAICNWIAYALFRAAYAIPVTTPPRDGRIKDRFHIFPDPGNSPGERDILSESTITDIVVVLVLALLLAGGLIWFIRRRSHPSNSRCKQQTRIDLPAAIGRPASLVSYPPPAHLETKEHGKAAYPRAPTS